MTEMLRCPKCSCSMEAVTHGGIQVDRCSGCRGLWFDRLEADQLKALADSKEVDLGPPPGGGFDRLRDYPCPRCGGAMKQAAVAGQPHIRYEACERCRGFFFDAGEFKDFAEKSVLDVFKSLAEKARRRLGGT